MTRPIPLPRPRRRTVGGLTMAAGLLAVVAHLAGAQATPPPGTPAAGAAPTAAGPAGAPVQPAATFPFADLVPNEQFVYGYPLQGFDTEAFVVQQGGYLARYNETVGGEVLTGGQIVERVAGSFSLSPKVLLALIQTYSRWVTDPQPVETSYPVGEPLPGLYAGLTAAANDLNRLYYAHRWDDLRSFPVAGGRQILLEGTGAGTFALVGYLSRTVTVDQWAGLEGPSRFQLAYSRLFGDPYRDLAVEPPPPPATLTLALPFTNGEMWYYVLGPHSPVGVGGARAAIDFSPPPAEATGCFDSPAWVTAVAPGRVIRADEDGVVVDAVTPNYPLDDFEGTGWVHVYLHVGAVERVAAGTVVKVGDHLGHPSCTGTTVPLSRVAFARRYNGEWVPVDDPQARLELGGWVALPAPQAGAGYLAATGQPTRVAGLEKRDATNGVLVVPGGP
jgi:LasA protease